MVKVFKEQVRGSSLIKRFQWYYVENNCTVGHRDNGLPAILSTLKHVFIVHGKKNRFNGPADIFVYNFSGNSTLWCIGGRHISPLEYLEWLDENDMDINNLTPDEELLITMYWGDNG